MLVSGKSTYARTKILSFAFLIPPNRHYHKVRKTLAETQDSYGVETSLAIVTHLGCNLIKNATMYGRLDKGNNKHTSLLINGT